MTFTFSDIWTTATQRRLLVFAVIFILTNVVVVGTVSAQPDRSLQLQFDAISGVVDLRDPDPVIEISVNVGANQRSRNRLRMVGTVHASVSTRFELIEALGEDRPPVYSSFSQALEPMEEGTHRVITVRIPASELDLSTDTESGVYPLVLQFYDRSRSVGELATAVIVIGDTPADPLPLSVIVNMALPIPPVVGNNDTALRQATRHNGEVSTASRMLQTLANQGGSGLSFSVDGKQLGDLEHFASSEHPGQELAQRRVSVFLNRLRSMTQRGDVQVLSEPYASADISALTHNNMNALAQTLISEGREEVRRRLHRSPSSDIVVVPTGLDPQTLAAIAPSRPVSYLLQPRFITQAEDIEPSLSIRTEDGGIAQLLVPDSTVSSAVNITSERGIAWQTQHTLALTAVDWISETPGVLISASPDQHNADTAVVVNALRSAPWLRPMNLSSFQDETSPNFAQLRYPQQERDAELSGAYIDQLRTALRYLVPLQSTLENEDVSPDQQELWACASTAFRDPKLRQTPSSVIEEVHQSLADHAGNVTVLNNARITLTSTTGEVPVTVMNAGSDPLTVHVQATAARFTFENEATSGISASVQEVTLPPRSSTRLSFTVTARNPGALAPIEVTVTDPTEYAIFASEQVLVRSSAIPVFGLLTVAGSVLLFLYLTGRQLLRQVRRRESSPPLRKAG